SAAAPVGGAGWAGDCGERGGTPSPFGVEAVGCERVGAVGGLPSSPVGQNRMAATAPRPRTTNESRVMARTNRRELERAGAGSTDLAVGSDAAGSGAVRLARNCGGGADTRTASITEVDSGPACSSLTARTSS